MSNPRIFMQPSSIDEAFAFCNSLLGQPHCEIVRPGPRHWSIFTGLCLEADIRGPRVPDAWFAALAIEHGCVWITCDRDYARFPQLKLARANAIVSSPPVGCHGSCPPCRLSPKERVGRSPCSTARTVRIGRGAMVRMSAQKLKACCAVSGGPTRTPSSSSMRVFVFAPPGAKKPPILPRTPARGGRE